MLALSLVTPVIGGTGPAATATLVIMHLIVGAVLVALLPRR